MAFMATCPRCEQYKVIDTHCGPHCFDCLDGCNPDLHHEATCPTTIAKVKEKARSTLYWHESLSNANFERSKLNELIHATKNILTTIDPCPTCNGKNKYCPACNGKGYAPLTAERREELNKIANAPDPPISC